MRIALMLSGCLLAGCGGLREAGTGPLETTHKEIDKSRAELVQAEITMGAGEMTLGPGAAKLLEADFTTNVEAWRPEVRYEDSSFRARLSVRQPKSPGGFHGDVKNEWNMKLAGDVPLSLEVTLGAGESKLALGSLTLRDAEVRMGAGRCELDLRGEPKRSYEVRVRGGVGEAIIRVSRNAAVQAEASGGIGEVKVTGMEQDGRVWTTPTYGKTKSSIRLDVKGGIGSIRIEAE